MGLVQSEHVFKQYTIPMPRTGISASFATDVMSKIDSYQWKKAGLIAI
jgi:hypothetical protein